MKILSFILLIISLLLEWVFVHYLLNDLIHISLLIHLFATLSIVGACKLFLMHRYKHIPWTFYLYFLLQGFFVPVFGLFINLFVLLSIDRFHASTHQHVEIKDMAINLNLIKPIHIQYGSGGALRTLLKKNESTMERTKALFILGQNQLANINSLMYQLLSDNSDEIRLLAFNILDQQESFIMEDINKIKAMLDQKKISKTRYAKFEKNLAELYWELVYRHLILSELESLMLNKALSYALSALSILSEDAKLWALLGDIYKHLGEVTKAEEVLNKALSLNIPPSQVLPYLAEIEYKKHDYPAVKKFLGSEVLLDITMVQPVKAFWDKR